MTDVNDSVLVAMTAQNDSRRPVSLALIVVVASQATLDRGILWDRLLICDTTADVA